MESNDNTKSKDTSKKAKGLKGLLDEIDVSKKKKKNKNKDKKNSENTKTKPDFSKFSSSNNSSSDFKGLKNFGNSCYSNVVIQILTSIPEFLDVLQKRYQIVENEDNLISDYPLLYRLVEIISNYKTKNTSLASNYLRQIVSKFDKTGSQNDAHEFLVYVLDTLNEEMLNIESNYKINNNNNSNKEEDKKENNEGISGNIGGNKINVISNNSNTITNHKECENEDENEGEWEEVKKGGKTMRQVNSIKNFKTSILGKIFQGIIKQDVIQKGKSSSNCQIEPFFTLHLDNNAPSIDLMFQKFFQKRNIENTEKSTQSFIEKLPEIFIVNPKGFFYDKKNFKIVKIKENLIFEEKLTLSKNYFSPHLRNKDFTYELTGIIVHKGNLATEGHYICYCKDQKDKKWFYLDDNKVIHVGDDTIHNLRPYVLFYRKCG